MFLSIKRSIQHYLELLKHAYRYWRKDNASFLAAGLSYYIVFAFGPLLVILVYFISLIVRIESVRQNIITQIGSLMGPQNSSLIIDLITNLSDQKYGSLAGLIALGGLLFTVYGLINHIRHAAISIWCDEISASHRMKYSKGNIRIAGGLLGVGILWVLGVGGANALRILNGYLGITQINEIASNTLLFLVGVLTFALSARILSPVSINIKKLVIISFFTTILFQIGTTLLKLYLNSISSSPVYGTAGTFALLLVWIYYSTQLYIFGLEIVKASYIKSKKNAS